MAATNTLKSTSAAPGKNHLRDATIGTLGFLSVMGAGSSALAETAPAARTAIPAAASPEKVCTTVDAAKYEALLALDEKNIHDAKAKRLADMKAAAQIGCLKGEQHSAKPHVFRAAPKKEEASPPAPPVAAAAPPPPPPPVDAAPPPPPPPVDAAPPPPPPPNGGLGYITFDARQPIDLPMGDMSKADVKYAAQSDCNGGSPIKALMRPFNARCLNYDVSKTVTVVGLLGTNAAGAPVFVVTNPVVEQITHGIHGAQGQGWFRDVTQAAIGAYGLVLESKAIGIAQEGLNQTINLNAKIIAGIGNGSFGSLFGSLGGCGIGGASQSKVAGSVSGICIINSGVSNSPIGVANSANPTGTVSNINLGYTYGYGLAPTTPVPAVTQAAIPAP